MSSRRSATSIRVVLSLHLASWLALHPLLQVAHLTLADHAHRYCAEHGRVEDVPHRHALLVQTPHDAQAAGSARWWGHGARAQQPSHLACAILGQGSSRDPARPADSGTPLQRPDGPSDLASRGPSTFTCSSLILTAPKTSPPGFVA